MLKRLILPAALLAVAGAAGAQTSTPTTTTPPATTTSTKSAAPQLTAEQKAALVKANQQVTQAAQQVIGLIDQGKYGEAWDEMSSVAKQAVTRDAFIKIVSSERAKLGKPGSRKLAFISRNFSKGSQLPAGWYVNVTYATQFANAKQPQSELVSFHIDNDKVRRLSGYSLNAPVAAARPAQSK